MSKREKSLTFIAGKRKNAVAQVSLVENKKKSGAIFLKYTGKFDAKKVPIEDFFISKTLIFRVEKPLLITKTENLFDINIKLSGGGISAQASACSLGIARALVKKKPKLRILLHQHGLLTRDSRVKERKKYGLKKARKAPQFSKR